MWPRRPTTPSGGSTSGGRAGPGAASCARPRRLAEGPFGDALEIGAGTGYFSLNLLQAGAIERRPRRTSRPGCWSPWRRRGPARPRRQDRRRRGGDTSLPGRELRPRLRPRGPPSHPDLVRRSGVRRCRARGGPWRSAVSRLGTATCWRDPEADGAAHGAALAPADGRLGAAEDPERARPRPGAGGRRARLLAGDLRRFCRRGRVRRRQGEARSCSRRSTAGP